MGPAQRGAFSSPLDAFYFRVYLSHVAVNSAIGLGNPDI